MPPWDARGIPHFNHDTTRPTPRSALPYVPLGRRPPESGPGPGALPCMAERRSVRRWDLRASCAEWLCLIRRFFVSHPPHGRYVDRHGGMCVDSSDGSTSTCVNSHIPASKALDCA